MIRKLNIKVFIFRDGKNLTRSDDKFYPHFILCFSSTGFLSPPKFWLRRKNLPASSTTTDHHDNTWISHHSVRKHRKQSRSPTREEKKQVERRHERHVAWAESCTELRAPSALFEFNYTKQGGGGVGGSLRKERTIIQRERDKDKGEEEEEGNHF